MYNVTFAPTINPQYLDFDPSWEWSVYAILSPILEVNSCLVLAGFLWLSN